MLETDKVLQKLLMFYDLDNMSQLAEKIGVSQPTISKWKSRGSILPVKKICKELGIYSEIFGDLNSSINNQTIRDNHGNLSQIGNVHTQNQKDDNNLNIDEAVFAMFKRAYNKCLDEDNEIIEDKIDELIAHLMKFK